MAEDSKKANELRKKGDLDAALPIYQQLWITSKDKFAAAGLTFCYRKLRNFDEAIPLATEAYKMFPDFDWCRNEYIWCLIQGKLYNLPETTPLEEYINLAQVILEASPDTIALKITVFRVLKMAKKQGQWGVLNDWITRISPDVLDGYTDETSGWTDKELWYYYRVNGLINSNQADDAITLIETNKEFFYKKMKFFDRLKAKVFLNSDKVAEAKGIYKALSDKRTDWWIVHEYGTILLNMGETDEALGTLMNAALMPPMKPELKVSLYKDIAETLLQKGRPEDALVHFRLAKAIRVKEGWTLGDLESKIALLSGVAEKDGKEEIRELISQCQAIWKAGCSIGADRSLPVSAKNVKGKIGKLDRSKPYCFLLSQDNQSYFCSQNDLPNGSESGHLVIFDLKKSFDKKKGKESFTAINIRSTK